MVISTAEATTIDIRLIESLATGAGGIGDRSGLQLRVQTEDGLTGRGETAPIPGVEGQGLEAIAVEIERWCTTAAGKSVDAAASSLDDTDIGALARFAIHTALIDLQSQNAKLPAATWLRSDAPSHVAANGLVTDSNPGAVHARVSELVQASMKAIKLKVAMGDPSQDVTRIIAASEAAGPNVALRLDANRAWDRAAAEKVIGRVGRHRLDFVEDPTDNPSDYHAIEESTGVPIALDLPITDNPAEAIAAANVSIVVVKPAAIGGIDRVLKLAADHPALRVVVSSSIDREIGLAAAVHLAAALPNDDEVHGIATGGLVRDMPAALLPADGAVNVPESNGIWIGDTADSEDSP